MMVNANALKYIFDLWNCYSCVLANSSVKIQRIDVKFSNYSIFMN